jgi:4-amino-4-deoxy-L-arabinose transferase-like glycosyltransferase
MSERRPLAIRRSTESGALTAHPRASLNPQADHPSPTRSRSHRHTERWVIGGIALAVLALHLATNGLYGFQRDEMYYLDSARHLAWGFVDYPPLTPAIARVSLQLFGPTSVWGLRLWPTLAGAVMVVLSAQIAFELGGGRTARILAAIGAATSPVLLGANWLFQTVTFDQLMWLVCVWLTARLARTGDRRLWLALGTAVGVGLETKYTIVALVAGLTVAVAVTPLRRHLRTPWPWLGVLAASLIFVPNLIWQIANGWPSVAFTVAHPAAQSGDFGPLAFLSEQLALIGPLAIPLWVAGLYWLFSGRGRAVGVAALVAFLIFMFVGKGYYIGPLHPALLAAGACALESWTCQRRRWLRSTTAVALVLQGVVLAPIAIPLFPESVMARSALPSVRTDFADTVGWQDLVVGVAAVYNRLPATVQSSAVILADNFGEAGALNTYGPALGLPRAVSGELTYYFWRPARVDGPVIAIGVDIAFLSTLFHDCATVANVSNSYDLDNQEFGAPIVVCGQPKLPLDQLWSRLKSFE